MKKNLFIIYIIFLTSVFYGQITLNRTHFDFGNVPPGTILSDTVKLSSSSPSEITLAVMSSCTCLTADKESVTLTPDRAGEFTFSFDTTGYSGATSGEFILTNGDITLTVTIQMNVISGKNLKSEPQNEKKDPIIIGAKDNILKIISYKNCRSCIKLIKKAGQNRAKLGVSEIVLYPLEYAENKSNLMKIVKSSSKRDLPIALFNGEIYSGEGEITGFLNGTKTLSSGTGLFTGTAAIFISGLIDGINPCVFTAIIFLISYLSLNLKKRSDIFITGILFIITVYITYFLTGAGLFEVLKRLSYFKMIGLILKHLLSLFLSVLIVLTVIDIVKAWKGKSDEMILKLPDFLNNSMRNVIRKEMKNYRLMSGAIFLGFAVSLFEFACTGQIYLPVIGYMIQNTDFAGGIKLLLLYNTAFIIPLLIIFALVYAGISSQKIGKFLSGKIKEIKIIFLIIFISFLIMNFVF